MAEIDLQRKRGGAWWPWVVGLLVVLLLVWAIAEALGGDEEEAPVAAADTVVDARQTPAIAPPPEFATAGEARAALPSTVREYRQACTQAGQAPTDMGVQHDFTINCMRLMANSFEATVQSDTVGSVALEQRLETFRSNADRLSESDPTATTHAGTVAEAMESAADLLTTLREERRPDDQEMERAAQRARDAAESMSQERPLLDQQDAVEEFFQAMGTALEALATGSEQP